MLKNNFPIGSGNVDVITTKTVRENIFQIKRLEDIFDFYSDEPSSITVKKEENNEKELFRCILRIRVWRSKHNNFAWSIYTKDKETFSSLIIRRVVWDLDKDTELFMRHFRENQAELSERWPSVEICNTYISTHQSEKVIHLINNLDAEIKEGFILKENNNPSWKYRDLELLRLYDKRQIHFTWSPTKENKGVQNKIKQLVLGLDLAIEEANENIFEMVLNYSEDPEKYKEAVHMLKKNPICNR